MRASKADRDRAIEVLKVSYAEGRLTRQELDLRLGQALVSRFFEELMLLTADLPVGPFGRLPAHRVTPVARRRVRRTGERGFDIAAAVAVLGCLTVLIAVVVALLAA
jgi:hypothetical protein